MSMLDLLLDSAKGGSLKQAAQSFGLDDTQATSLLAQVVPALGRSMQNNMKTQDGFQGLQKALITGNHQQYLDNASALTNQATITDGNKILGHLFGSKDVSRNVASRAAANTGLDIGMIKQFLPMIAAATMGAMSKQSSAGQSLRTETQGDSMLSSLLDSDNDGQVLDDVLNLASKLF